jgi:hypothetical protein
MGTLDRVHLFLRNSTLGVSSQPEFHIHEHPMKSIFAFALVLTAFLYGCGEGTGTATRYERPADDPFSLLNAYGTWFDAPGLGTVWQPSLAYEWRPYRDGQWIWTDRGWVWASDEPFAWIVYHYGYWTRWGGPGWVWVPAYEWSPSRVRWSSGDEYIGWAPMPPPQVQFPQAYATGYEDVWIMVPARRFTEANVGQYRATSPIPRPGVTRGTGRDRAPDVGNIQRLRNEEIRARQIEQEDVRQGQRTLTRMRIKDEERPRPEPRTEPVLPPPVRQPVAPPPPAVVTPPPVQPTPAPTRRGTVRPQGEKKSPADKTAPASRGAERQPRVVQPPPTAQTPRDTARVRQARPAPKREEKSREERR